METYEIRTICKNIFVHWISSWKAEMISSILLIVFPLCMAMAAMTDMLSMTIPNRVSLVLAAAFLLLVPFLGFGLADIGWHLLAGLCVFAACFGLFAINVMGGGDAKILAASALWFGFGQELIVYLTYVGYLGGILTLLMVLLRAQIAANLATIFPIPSHFTDGTKGVPYGMAIGLAALITYPDTKIFALAIAG